MKRYEDFIYMLKENGIILVDHINYSIDKYGEFLKNVDCDEVDNEEQKPHRFFELNVNGVKLKVGVTVMTNTFNEKRHYYWCE